MGISAHPVTSGSRIPPAGKMPGIGPAPAANTMISISPSQNVGTDQNVSATPVLTRSLVLPCRQPVRIPSHSPSTAEITVAVPTSRMVGPQLLPDQPGHRLRAAVLVRRAEVEPRQLTDVVEELPPQRLVQPELVAERLELGQADALVLGHRAHRVAGQHPEQEEPDEGDRQQGQGRAEQPPADVPGLLADSQRGPTSARRPSRSDAASAGSRRSAPTTTTPAPTPSTAVPTESSSRRHRRRPRPALPTTSPSSRPGRRCCRSRRAAAAGCPPRRRRSGRPRACRGSRR